MENKAAMPRPELVQVADSVARDKNIDKEDVFVAMEQAIQKAARSKYGMENDIRAEINRKNGEIKLYRYQEVVADDEILEEEFTKIHLKRALKKNPEAKIGDFITDLLPPIDFGRIAAQTAKQIITQKVRDAERKKQYEEFKDKIGEIINGVVKRVEFGNVIIDFGKNEAILRKEDLIPREVFRNGDRCRAFIVDVRPEAKGQQIFLSRTCPEFMAKLFAAEVPEIYDGIISIKAVARDPGSRAKIAVKSSDSSIDAVGACVGLRGTRVQAVVNELQGEKVDIVAWSDDKAAFVINALTPAEVSKVVIDEENNRIEIIVPEDQLSLAIGRRGQNVKLASELTGFNIDILTEDQEAERRQNELKVKSQRFIDALNIEDMIAHLLVSEGFSKVEEIAAVNTAELSSIEGFDEDVALELQNRAKEWLELKKKEFQASSKKLGIENELAEQKGLNYEMLLKLGKSGIKTLDDLADLAGDELVEILGEDALSETEANAIILKAREHWFNDEEKCKSKKEK